MLNNFVNQEDLAALIRYGPKILSKIVPHLSLAASERTKQAWAHTQKPPTYWGSLPLVQNRWNYLMTGDPNVDYYTYISRKYLAKQENLVALSLGCGTGHREIKWAKQEKFQRIDAYDLSAFRIEKAKQSARETDLDHIINYFVSDIFDIEMRESFYDLILVEQALHHFSPMEEVLSRVNQSLKPDGYFIVNEFVGPSRFQWTDRQVEVVKGLLAVIPSKYHLLWGQNGRKKKFFRPSLLRMVLLDPSEAVESSKIRLLLKENFEIEEAREYGGTIVAPLVNGIAHNFASGDAEAEFWLQVCFDVEDRLLANEEISSDFLLAVCRKRRQRDGL